MGDQGLLLGKLQLEFFQKERSELMLDFLGFCLRSCEPQEEVIRIPEVAEPSILRVVGVGIGQTALLLARRLRYRAISRLPGFGGFVLPFPVFGIGVPLGASGILREKGIGHKSIQPIQVDVGEDRADNPALWRAAERRAVLPLRQIPGLE